MSQQTSTQNTIAHILDIMPRYSTKRKTRRSTKKPYSRGGKPWKPQVSGASKVRNKYANPGGDLNIRASSSLNKGFFPPSVRGRHTYSAMCQVITDSTTGYSSAEEAFRLNSLYDPAIAASGLLDHQPQFFDQVSALYRLYKVYKVDVHIQIVRVGGIAPSFVTNVRPSGSTYNLIGSQDPATLVEKQGNTVSQVQAGSVLNWSYHIADIDGVPRASIFNDDAYSALYNGNPGRTPFLSFAASSQLAGADTSAEIDFRLSLTYHAEWSQLKTLAQS